ncbi:MAG: M20/M25/M40 family metallo-hydrolase [Eubacteriales bacterium]|nr:M20/M25/M40 family metallo-hydrolase [Eubacteriales bacterium]
MKNAMNEMKRIALEYIDRYEESMLRLWKNLVTMESPSADRDANEMIAAHLDTYCDAMGMEREIYHFEKAGPTFTAWTGTGRLAPIALIGHFDTVHPKGKFGDDPFVIEGDTVHGPGVYDMKGGVVIALYAIRALQAAGYDERQIKLLLSGDEEVAHALSDGEGGHLMELHTEGCAAVFNCESGYEGEEVTIQRKGGAVFRIHVKGKAAHAGKDPEKGASAILQAAHMISEIESHTVIGDMTFNCGRISGGSGANIIPDSCDFVMAVRYCTNQQYEEARNLILELCENVSIPGTSCTMEQNGFYPAMEPAERTGELLEVYKAACRELGAYVPEGVFQGGCSDSAFATRIGIPTLCSLGVQGDNAHSIDEEAYVSSLALQCKKLILTILSLPEEFL